MERILISHPDFRVVEKEGKFFMSPTANQWRWVPLLEEEVAELEEDPKKWDTLLLSKYQEEWGKIRGSYFFAEDFDLPYTLEKVEYVEGSQGWIVQAHIPLPDGTALVIKEWGMENPYDDPQYARYEWIED